MVLTATQRELETTPSYTVDHNNNSSNDGNNSNNVNIRNNNSSNTDDTKTAPRHRHCDISSKTTTTNNVTTAQQTSSPKESTSLLTCEYSNTGFYDCNICFDTAVYPVLTVCGHLFCWVCLSRWLEQQNINPTCPMCKAGCSENRIIPVYGRGREEIDPRCDASIPNRPSGQRPEPLHNPNIAGSSFFHSLSGNRSGHRSMEGHSIFLSNPRLSQHNLHPHQSNGFLSRLMLMILSLFIVVIVFY